MALHVEEIGTGPVIALGHGFGGSARNFRPQARALRDAFRFLLFDARGHARSDAPDDPRAYTPAALASDLQRVLDDAGVERAFVGGLSLGAAVALRFALERPDRVRGLVLASYPASGGAARARAFAEAIEAGGLEAAGARFVWGPESGLDERGAALVRQGFLEHAPHALAHLLRETIAVLPEPASLASGLEASGVPTLLVAGSRDTGSLAACRSLAGGSARLAEIEGAGHVVNLERPREFNRILRTFLRAREGG